MFLCLFLFTVHKAKLTSVYAYSALDRERKRKWCSGRSPTMAPRPRWPDSVLALEQMNAGHRGTSFLLFLLLPQYTAQFHLFILFLILGSVREQREKGTACKRFQILDHVIRKRKEKSYIGPRLWARSACRTYILWRRSRPLIPFFLSVLWDGRVRF